MKLVEQHVIEKGDPRYTRIDKAAFASKNLWNLANYYVRQSFIFEHTYLNNTAVYHLVKSSDAYKALPRKVSNQVLIQLDAAWTAFFEEVEAYREHPERFTGRPKLPKYKHQTQGRNLLVFERGAIWKSHLAHREIAVSQLGWLVETRQNPKHIKQVRIVPKADHYVVEVVYQVEAKPAQVDKDLFVALDPGVNVLAALTSNKLGFSPRLVPGGPLKAMNQLYNQQREHEQKQLAKGKEQRFTSRRLDRITTKRNRRVMHYLHTASRRIIDLLVEEGIGTLVIGLNRLWKQEADLGRRNNQGFVQIPHSRFIEMLEYKAKLVGIGVIVREESYTSQASFLDRDEIPTYDPDRKEKPVFSGKREERGLYRAKDGRRIQADVNGSYNTLRKEFPNAFSDSQARVGQEIGAQQLRLAAWMGSVGRISVPPSSLAV